ncbi:glyoxalase [Lysobacter pythonis]|uniref:Glyoxalase n=1 Tax=Solilutibacter pythonis TaxID=2483112 RepID=A0A3M2I5S2_9GAMM|nr:VOC family protein [Lysobacter pythonis]RMH93807.1 glyoxalase [Lysobacter pythonis]
MEIECIAGFAVITKQPSASVALYRERLGLPLAGQEDYLFMDRFPGSNHFGVWPLAMAARTCFGQDEWPGHVPEPTATLEFELVDAGAVAAAVEEMKEQGHAFIHEARTEPWGQTVARFISPEGVLIGLSHAPWLHERDG